MTDTLSSAQPSADLPTATVHDAEQLESLSPITGDVVGRYPVADAEAVADAIARAREAADWWAALDFGRRKAVLDQWRGVLARRMAQLADVVHRETGKPHADAQLEIGLAVDHLAWAAGHAKKVLGPHRVSAGLLMANQAATVEYLPRGVIGVIGPWNYPVFTPMGSIAYALAAGNAVVFKPSELTPGVGQWLADSLAEVVPDGRPLLQCVHGRGEVGDALCRSGVDKLAFTGSTATGRKVMAACAETLTPVLIEAGGKDAMLVADDADVSAAADAAAWGAFSNAGQTCVGIERVYVHESVADEFVRELTSRTAGLSAAGDVGSAYGPMTLPGQVDVVRRHVTDAVERGGRAVVGGVEAVGEAYVQPTVLVDVPEDSSAVTEETFGPTVVVNRVASMDEAVSRANGTGYGLGGSVFSKAQGMTLARAMRSGMVAVNGVISFAGIPALPFGGVGSSGFGRIHGADGLREFASPKAIARQRVRPLMNLTSFGRTPAMDKNFATVIAALHGRATQFRKR
ncbi:aldehyde dehydrogenase family protein [Luteipulveratus flavus]|uniref:Aldehyde dehydrogenase n=1 Tax=Luteipulveratus flavus TaxID=3031728 RepID=A0ABT6C4T7_9MICO|nr:aldehyde dehydrogenase family protein [Luteipulveratus sp. YIM 133296]MDF8263563.1 aldehyde dehydrogenase family protein [Luteipulveratus sp. YIM 133296]